MSYARTIICLAGLLSIALRCAPAAAQERPQPPRNVNARALPDTRIEVTWEGVPGVDGYVIDRFESIGEAAERTFEVTGADQTTFVDDTELELGRAYIYRVRSKKGEQLSRLGGSGVRFARTVLEGDFLVVAPQDGKEVNTLRPEVRWSRVPGATGYEVAVTSDEGVRVYRVTTGPDDRLVKVDPRVLAPGTTYTATVTALFAGGAEGRPAVNSPEFATPSNLSLFDFLARHHLSLRRAFDPAAAVSTRRVSDSTPPIGEQVFEDPSSTDGALFSYSDTSKVVVDEDTKERSTEHDETVDIQFALTYTPPLGQPSADTFLSGLLSAEAKLSNTDFETNDALRFRAGVALDTFGIRDVPAPHGGTMVQRGVFDSTMTTFAVKYESDQDLDVQKLLGEVRFTPTIRRFAIGKAQPLPDPLDGLRVYWRPYLGLDVGRTLEASAGETQEVEDTVLRAVGRVRAKLLFPEVASALGLSRHDGVALFADDTMFYLPLEEGEKFHNYLEAGVEFKLTENFSLNFIYRVGEDSPDFLKQESLGVQF